jgi:hypothetical protein
MPMADANPGYTFQSGMLGQLLISSRQQLVSADNLPSTQ